jgi:conjugal transfer mating pair stabilization protein TraG
MSLTRVTLPRFTATRSWLGAAVSLGLGLAPVPALAVDSSFYTYDGFAETVDAFRLVSLIFADPRYETLVVICAVVGIALGAVLATVRGQGMGIVSFGLQMLFGIGLFVGLVSTTGTVNIYDKVRNAYQPVGGVPNLIVVVAGVTNLMERALRDHRRQHHRSRCQAGIRRGRPCFRSLPQCRFTAWAHHRHLPRCLDQGLRAAMLSRGTRIGVLWCR